MEFRGKDSTGVQFLLTYHKRYQEGESWLAASLVVNGLRIIGMVL